MLRRQRPEQARAKSASAMVSAAGLKSPTKSVYYVDFSFRNSSHLLLLKNVKKRRVQSNLPECRLVVEIEQ
jgi:hypothetical protein